MISGVQVTTLLSRLDKADTSGNGNGAASARDGLEAAVADQGALVQVAKAKAKESGSEEDVQAAKASVDKLLALKKALEAAEEGGIPMSKDGLVDYEEDFFGRRAYLAVSGQLNGMAPDHRTIRSVGNRLFSPACSICNAVEHTSLGTLKDW
jgi:hypothetical protein